MAPLSTELRNKLERTITEARDVAEAGACAALEGIAVHHFEPYKHQSVQQRKMRNHLRARARQLGDIQNAKGQLPIDHLAHECAYEHWHRMLFARFLAENNLLIEPSHGVAISLQECEELAKAADTDLWTYASRCAEQMLPQIFRPDDPLLQITLAREHQVKLERLLAALDPATFKADDSLGWVYQFWQSKKKDQVNESGQKITGDTLPAVTQLFTEHYMVLFLLHNTIGAWYTGKILAANPKLAKSAASEDELRKAVALTALGGYSFDYLRFVREDENSPWRPAAGIFDGWPKTISELKVLDPCCGSGHFLVAVFDLLIRLRMQEENLSVSDAIDAVLKDNIFGLEIDARCTQIAAFNLALAAWKLTGFRQLPGVHIACCGIGPQSTEEQWLKLVEESGIPMPMVGKEAVKNGLLNLHRLFSQASTLGSLIDPTQLPSDLIAADYETIKPYLAAAMAAETDDDELHERVIAAAGMVKAAELLAGEYTLVITNVPYLGRGKQNEILMDYCERVHSEAKGDLATCFVDRCIQFCAAAGSTVLVTPQNWLFLGTYKKFRNVLLRANQWNLLARLGSGAFGTISGEVVNVTLLGLTRRAPSASEVFIGMDFASAPTPSQKAIALKGEEFKMVGQLAQLRNPDARITLGEASEAPLFSTRIETGTGMQTFDRPRFIANFWEVKFGDGVWEVLQSTPSRESLSSGMTEAVRWENGEGGLRALMASKEETEGYTSGIWRAGSQFWGKRGILHGVMSDLPCALYLGVAYDTNAAVLIPRHDRDYAAVLAFSVSGEFSREVRKLDQKMMVTNATFTKVPFDLSHWQKVAAEKYPNGLPKPFSNDPTQWLFNGHPKGSDQPLHVAAARLLGYQWPRQTGSSFPDCPAIGSDGLENLTDDDGIVCIPSVRGEEPAAERLLAILAASGVKTDIDLEDWLRNRFFEEHCKLFHHRPFVWHIWDGRRRDGFHALVNYHKLAEGSGKGKKLLESLTYSYLGEWISRQQDGVRRGEGGAEDRLAAATELQEQLIAILEGQPPYDIFVRWKPLHEQPIGWEPDINDGVRMNIRPFLTNNLSNGRNGAGILRWKPNIKWGKDRGTEPQRPKTENPWFWGWDEKTTDFTGGPEFKGERFNACHYTNDCKRNARQVVEGS